VLFEIISYSDAAEHAEIRAHGDSTALE